MSAWVRLDRHPQASGTELAVSAWATHGVHNFLLVPPDLEITALNVLAGKGLPGRRTTTSTGGEGDGHRAPLAAARRRLIVVDF